VQYRFGVRRQVYRRIKSNLRLAKCGDAFSESIGSAQAAERSFSVLIKRTFFHLDLSTLAHVFCLIAFSSWDSDFRDAD
jgi:hypothetical protein